MHHVTDHLHHKSSTDTTSKSTGEKSSMTEKIMHPLHGHKHTEHEHETKKVESSKAYKPEHEHEFKKVEKKKPTERSALGGSESPHKHKVGKESGYDKHKHGTTSGGGHKHSHEHGLSGSQPHVHEHTHPVTSHGGEHLHKHQFGNETHVMHERSPLSPDEYQNLYRSGVDPVANREIECETHDQGGVIREKIGETPVIRELVKPVELHKVQPVIHREREQREIRHVIEPHTEFQVREVHVHHKDRDINLGVRQEGSTLGTSRSVGQVPHLESTREFGGVERQHQDLPARVEEHVHKVIEEHVHPVIYKEVLRPKVVEETHHIYETVKEAPIETVVDMSQKGLDRGLDEKLDEAKREFFAHESSRGIPCPLHGTTHEHRHDVSPQHAHAHAHVHERSSGSPLKHEHKEKIKKEPKEMLKKELPKKKKEKKLEKEKKPKVSAPFHVTPISHAEPIIGHHQNIGGHHIPATSIPQSSIYDRALAQTAPTATHSARDEGFVRGVTEKKLEEKEARRTGLVAPPTSSNVV